MADAPRRQQSVTTHEALPLRTVARLTGLTPDVIRAWEKRYGVVAPKRGPRGARLYTNADVSHLRLLRLVVSAGRAIGDVARLSPAELSTLATSVGERDGRVPTPHEMPAPPDVVMRALAALERFDVTALDRCLGDALVALGSRAFIEQVSAPLLHEVGVRWGDGRLSVADEHLLSGLLRNLLAGLMRSRHGGANPSVLLATPSGERHEFGLLLAGMVIADAGLTLLYLGTDLPSADVCAAARRGRVAVVGLGLVNGDNQAAALAEVRRIERDLPAATELWLGGRDAAVVAAKLGNTRAVVVDGLARIDAELARVRALGAGRA
jgi:DNA-binding transcriptional MerR regulator/methylmalonyl-CoA mutase cobalamin-binding subunit